MRIPQYEDSIQFHAELYIDGKHAGAASNDGNGGPCFYEGYTPEGRQLIAKAEAYFKGLPPVNLAKQGEEPSMMDQSLEYHISTLSYDYYNKQELHRQTLKGFVFGQNGENQWLEFKKPISHFLKHPNGESFLKKFPLNYLYRKCSFYYKFIFVIAMKKILENEVVPLMKEGDVLFNTNLPASVTEKLSEKQLAKKAPRVVKPDQPGRRKRL